MSKLLLFSAMIAQTLAASSVVRSEVVRPNVLFIAIDDLND